MAMVQLMSSPLNHRQAAGGNLFSLSSSPTRTNQELPEAFDTSFGSQMSISSSSEDIQDQYSNHHHHHPHHRQQSQQSQPEEQQTVRIHSPLGAALGTVLNAKSPGLAAKLNSSSSNLSFRSSSSNGNQSQNQMDISPSPSFKNIATINNQQRVRSSTISEQNKNRNGTSRRGQGFSESSPSTSTFDPNLGFGNRNENSIMSISDVSMASLSNVGQSSGNGLGGMGIINNSKEFREQASSSTNSSNDAASTSSSPPRSISSSSSRIIKSKSRSNSQSIQGSSRARSSSASLEKARHMDQPTKPECPPSAGSTLGRLFGMELSLNDNDDEEEYIHEEEGLGGDRDPTLKRRPSSLPLGGGVASSRPSISGSGILESQSISRPRPTLMQSFTSKPASNSDRTVRKQSSVDSISPNYFSNHQANSSSSSLGRPARSRHSSVESVFDGASQGSNPDLLTRASLGYTPSVHDTIIESPSLGELERRADLGDYFFDPQSPEHQQPAAQPSRPTSRSSGSSKRSNSPPNASRRPGPRPSLGIRKLEKAHSSTAVPTRAAMTGGSGSGTTKTLGKRSNPYGHGSKASGSGSVSSSASRQSQESQTNSGKGNADPIKRLTAPAPRRTQSASDYSGAFNSLLQTKNKDTRSSNLADVSMTSSIADSSMEQSPVRKRTMIGNEYPSGFDTGSPMASSARAALPRPSFLRKTSKDDASPLGYGTGIKRSNSRSSQGEDDSMVGISNSPAGIPSSPFMPGFGASEREGKVLPCFSVSNDGLMRVSSNTVSELLEGKYNSEIESFHIIDCRFGYEFQGGHIPGAINLNTLEKVKNHFLNPKRGLHYPNSDLPERSQSGKPDKNGKLKKDVLVFHCEFSAKRAPSMALALRQADRSLNSDYPNCHFPEIYILKGGYCEFFNDFSDKCQPKNYITMDDPRFQAKCSNELGAYRRQFERHRSFTYGDTKVNSNPLFQNSLGSRLNNNNNLKRRTTDMIQEDERDNSHTSNSSSNVEDSPSMAVVGRKTTTTSSLQVGNLKNHLSKAGVLSNENSRRPSLNSRAFTLGPNINLRPSSISNSNSNSNIDGMSQSNSNVSMLNGDQDVSFSSSTGDSSFEGGPGDYSPCAAASRRPSLLPQNSSSSSGNSLKSLNSLRPSASNQPQLGRLKLQRAGTTPNILG